ncbi:MAG: TolC family protein [Bacteroidales bacterium]|nr:TolC family protein [Bacteroidales bacterium]
MKNKIKLFGIFLGLVFFSVNGYAQKELKIGICLDAESYEYNQLSEHFKTELEALNLARFTLRFQELNSDWNAEKAQQNIQTFMQDTTIDVVVSVGYISSNAMAKQKHFAKPVIATNILDGEMQALELRDGKYSGIDNFTYIESFFSLKNDLVSFVQMYDNKHVTVFIPNTFKENFPQITSYFKQCIPKSELTVVSAGKQSVDAISNLPANTDGAFVLPLMEYSDLEIEKLFEELNKRHIPSLAVSGIDYLNKGATLSLSPKFTFQQFGRQLALRVLKISEGINPADISVHIDGFNRVPIVNMESVRQVDKFPEWNVLNQSILINLTQLPNSRTLNLRLALAEALENNMQGKMGKQDVKIAEKDVRIAKSNYLPQVELSGTGVGLSENLVEASMGQKGEFTITGSASLKQVLYSEQVMANIAIKKLLAENMKIADQKTVLDIVSNTSGAYIGLLFAKSNLLIQNENVNATMKNLELAKAKNEIGQNSISDVNRWISELNLNKMKLNDANALYKNNMYQINQILNKPIDEHIKIPDSSSIDKSIVLNQDLLTNIFKNPPLTEKYADFIIDQMKTNAPEIKQLSKNKEIIEKKSLMYKRQSYIPEAALFANADQAFVRNGVITNTQLPIPPPPDDITWNAGIRLSIPIFEGGKKIAERQKSMLELDKLNNQETDLLNQLESGIRSNVQKLRASFLEMELANNATQAAEDNFNSVQDAYSQGVADLIQLIDAQNVMIKTKYLANIAYYQYVMDYILIERLQGKFTFLGTESEKQAYTNQIQEYLIKVE